MRDILAALLVFLSIGAQDTAGQIKDPFSVISELDRLAQLDLWPGFDPASYPLALFDGADTYLFNHSSPPADFEAVSGSPEVYVYKGRHPTLRWNSNAEIGGVRTATILLNIDPNRPATEEASIIVHETFHIFQSLRHPTWTANEAHRFTFPVEDANNYMLTIVEDHALARALEAESDGAAASWAARALATRKERSAPLAPQHRAFETGLEMMEGTARYLGQLTLGKAESTETLLKTLPPDDFRWRPYATGCAIAALLDRLDLSWKRRIEEQAELTLEQALEDAVAKSGASPAEFTDDELTDFKRMAEEGIFNLLARRESLIAEFESREGWHVVLKVVPGTGLLATQNFDPITNALLGGGRMLHGNTLTLRNENGRVEMRNPRAKRGEFAGLNAMTTVDGEHPVFAGVSSVVFAGFEGEPKIDHGGGKVNISAEGFALEFSDASLERSDNRITVTLSKPQ